MLLYVLTHEAVEGLLRQKKVDFCFGLHDASPKIPAELIGP